MDSRHNMKNNTAVLAPDDAIRELKDGNNRFLQSRSTRKHMDLQRVMETSSSRSPRAVILTCSDSRVSPEIIFDLGIGDLYVVRNAGNVTDTLVIATLEYAITCKQAPVVVILGHTRCGAINAALAGENMGGSIGEILTKVQPSVDTVRSSEKKYEGERLVTEAVSLNVINSILCITRESKLICEAINNRTIKIIGAVYDVTNGKVTWL